MTEPKVHLYRRGLRAVCGVWAKNDGVRPDILTTRRIKNVTCLRCIRSEAVARKGDKR